MVLTDIVGDLAQISSADSVLELVLVLKALGVAALLYTIYVIIMGVLTFRRMKKLGHIEKKIDVMSKKVEGIDKKINKLLKKN